MKRTLIFMACILASVVMQAQEESNDYIPFVQNGKVWHVVRSAFNEGYHFEQYMLSGEEVVKDDKTYMKMYRRENNLTEIYDVALLREENRKVYIFDTDRQKEFLMFDYSLKAGDTYEIYSYDEQKMVTYKVLSVNDFTEGPEVIRYDNDNTPHRYLRKWMVCRTDDNSNQKTWIEGVGSLEYPLANLYEERPISSRRNLAYVEYYDVFSYLPFSFHNELGQVYGCNLPTGEADHSDDWHDQLTYELEGDRLHVYGKVLTQCGLNNYIYFYERETDDPLVHKIEIIICGVEPLADCMSLHATDFYVPSFNPNMNYIVVIRGEEYPVINKNSQEAYRTLVEEGKRWTYDNFMPLRPAEYDHYYYYDLRGDTLIAGQQCLKMYSENRNNDNTIRYEGALYEVNKKVYCFFPQKDKEELLYNFDCTVGDTIQVNIGKLVVKDIQTKDNGGIAIREYILHDVSEYEGEDDFDFSWIEGVGATKDFFAMIPMWGNYNNLNACELNGEKLYQTIVPDLTEKGYHKMGIEGKRWNYIHYYMEEDGFHEIPYSYVVKGDTIIRRTTYKKLWYQDENTERLVCLLLERGREVLKSVDFGDNSYDSPIMTSFFDFGREDFGRVFTWKAELNWGNTNWMVHGVDTIEVNNRPFRRYTCLQKYSKEGETLTTIEYNGKGVWHDIWVEGIGSASSGIEDQIPSHEPPVKTTSDYTYFVSCYENGECIFTADDFNIQPTPKPDIGMAYYYDKGNKIPLTLNDNKVVVSIPKDCGEITERFRANVQTLFMINDETFDIYVIPQSEYEKLTTLDFWEKDAKSIVLTSSYFTESNEEVFATPYLNVKLKKEEDIDLLTSYAEQYKLTIVGNSAFMPLWYILAVTPESGKSPLECANELYESGDFAASIPDLASDIFPQTAYRPFVEDGKVWQVGAVNSGNPVQWVEYIYFDGDTIIDGKTCKQMMCQRYVSPDYPEYDYISQQPSLSYVGAWYEEDKKVYEYDSTNQQFKLMYDFSVDDNATLQINGQSYVIGPRQTGGIKGFKGVYRDVMMCKEGGGTVWSTPWLEGVGGIYGMTTNVIDGELADPEWFLMSCTVGDEVIYLNDEYEDGATPEGMNAKKRFDFTHTIKTQPKAPMRRVAEQSLYGEYNNQQLGINLNSLEDAYLVRITDKTGKVVYEKDINAGNIVGLNINISTYGDGRYTVTMENNHESFTGEFEVQTSGIEEVRNNHEMIKGYIYNLQGQRISTLQKGLNIVNGRKIYVK